MKMFVKSYMVLARPLFRILMLAVLPLFAVAVTLICHYGWDYHVERIMIPVITFLEIAADAWMFGGVYAKGTKMFDLMKGSLRGRKMMRDAMRFDMLQRLVISAVCIGASMGVSGWRWSCAVLEIGCVYLCSQLCLLLSRHCGTIRLQIVAGYLGFLATAILSVVTMVYTISDAALKFMMVMAGVLVIVVSVLTDWYHRRKIRKSFYDEKMGEAGG